MHDSEEKKLPLVSPLNSALNPLNFSLPKAFTPPPPPHQRIVILTSIVNLTS